MGSLPRELTCDFYTNSAIPIVQLRVWRQTVLDVTNDLPEAEKMLEGPSQICRKQWSGLPECFMTRRVVQQGTSEVSYIRAIPQFGEYP